MIVALLIPAFWSLSLIGLGHAFLKCLFPKHFQKIPPEQCLIGGFFAIVFIAQIYHLFFRISPGFSAVLLVSGLLCFFKSKNLRRDRFLYASLSMVSIAVAPHLIAPMNIHDSGLYHLQSILWNLEAPLVRGLANVHTRFGFNSNYLLLTGVLFPFKSLPQGFSLANGVMANILLLPLLKGVWDVWKGQKISIPSLYLLASSLYVIGFMYKYSNSPGTDLPVLVMATISFYFLLRYGKSEKFGYLVAFSLATVLGTTFKLTLAPYALFGLVFAIKHFAIHETVKRSFFLLHSLLALLVLLWFYRFYVMSGCWIVPLAETCAASDQYWAVSPERIADAHDWIKSWARHPGLNPQHHIFDNFKWFPLWLENNIYSNPKNALLVVLSALSLPYLAARFFVKKNSLLGMLLLMHISAVSYWFFTAPNFRLGAFYLVILSAHAAGDFASKPAIPQKLSKAFVWAGCIVVVAFSVWFHGRAFLGNGRYAGKTFPEVETVDYYKTGGVVFKHPIGGEQCWVAPLPCTPKNEGAFRVEKKNGVITEIGRMGND